jgi:DNA polymerase III delta prime subunit
MSQFVDNDGWEIQKSKAKPSREKNTAANWTLPSIDFIPPTTDPPNFQQFMLLLCGIPGSGKSTFARALERAMPYKVCFRYHRAIKRAIKEQTQFTYLIIHSNLIYFSLFVSIKTN